MHTPTWTHSYSAVCVTRRVARVHTVLHGAYTRHVWEVAQARAELCGCSRRRSGHCLDAPGFRQPAAPAGA